MLGYVLGITLVLAVFSPVVFLDVFADSIIVDFDKPLYELGDSLTISGEILEVGMPVIAMSIYDPDGKVLSANNLEISSESTFSKTISLDSPFYEKPGEYLVKLDYGQISENHYFLMDGELSAPEIIIEEEPEIILLYTEKNQYTDNEIIEIVGLVSSVDSPTALIGIYDPFGMPAGFYFGSIDSNMEFSTSFLAKDGVNFRVDGTYSVKAHYADSEVTSYFDYYGVLPETEETFPDDQIDDTTTEIDSTIDTTTDTTTEIDSTIDIADDATPETNSTDETTSEQPSNPVVNPTPTQTKSPEKNNKEITNTVLESKPIKKTNDKPTKDTKVHKENNLTVEDIELGKLLNEIKLECDSSTYDDTISYYDGMGPALYRLCNFDSSLDFFNESLINNPNDVEILVNKGSTLGKLGYYSEALIFYDHAIRLDPSFLPAKNNKANALANMGNLDDAILLYIEVLKQNPNYYTAQKNLQIALAANIVSSETVDISTDENNYDENSSSKTILMTESEKQTSPNFFDEVGIAFSTLGSLFGFLN
ncbi:tetratricopeptide repeat-containing protein [Nitrosopumilus oxyclinae]|uniref:Tetratricopeptide repeat-containing protein n=1 Tax=Nitrosopumilus oxyclinae TaxID=1959104 RepID=A0A7D5M1B5_9ARCH|nr:tetratricopeptide repeat protein [Nitrosopumilus oxyclinae]QLH04192.1 tetratricopeptide repeat-containing protein [Nitrosopumilus oxyclinae]